jgi:hypothetical protein
MWTAWINLVMGLFLIVSGFINDLRNPLLITAAGIVVLLLGLAGFVSKKSWEGLLNCFVGIWLILCGSWFNFLMPWNFFVTGGFVFVFAIWNIAEHPQTKSSPDSV